MTSTGTTRVWDLADASRGRTVRRRGTDLGGPVAAALGAVALGGAVAPGLAVDARWCLVAAAGVVAVLVGFSAVRRRQALASLLLAVVGLLAPFGAVALVTNATLHAPVTVTSAVVGDSALVTGTDGVTTSANFSTLSQHDRSGAEAFATALVLRLRTLHGDWGPYPASLVLSNGTLVEGPGVMEGTELGVVPAGSRLVYDVSSSLSVFRVTVVSATNPSATVSASSPLAIPGAA